MVTVTGLIAGAAGSTLPLLILTVISVACLSDVSRVVAVCGIKRRTSTRGGRQEACVSDEPTPCCRPVGGAGCRLARGRGESGSARRAGARPHAVGWIGAPLRAGARAPARRAESSKGLAGRLRSFASCSGGGPPRTSVGPQYLYPRCTATMPPERLWYRHPSSPAACIMASSFSWFGCMRIDSAR